MGPGAGQLIAGRYVLGDVLGRGGMGEVRQAHDQRLARDVALKILDEQARNRPDALARFEYEAQAAASLVHPNVVRVYDYGDDGTRVYLVMEVLSGRTLGDEIARGPIAPERLVDVACDVLAGLAAAHAIGIVHRDIKPGNVLFDDRDRAKLADFGVATSGSLDLTQTGLVLGTPAYVAPERLAGRPATARSDLFALGVVCYEALSGVKPFTGDGPLAVARAIERGQPLHLRERQPDLPPTLCDVVMQAMHGDADHRFRSADELSSALRAAMTTSGGAVYAGNETQAITATTSAGDEAGVSRTEAIPRLEAQTRALPVQPREPSPAPVAGRGRNRRVAAVVVLVAVLLAAGAIALVVRDRNHGSGGGNGAQQQTEAPLPAGPVRDAFDRLEVLVQP
ncbi:MAG: eukaryotic-like serine/threonine-protein kinase [Actinomycetota bacterium]|nr:eukaryotic-like serine/threonine-protein kinase [Actinomycetota bacterium]